MENSLSITGESNLEDIKTKIASGLVNEIIVEPKGNELFNSCIQSLTDSKHITYITFNTIDNITLENLLNLVNSNVFIRDIHISVPISNQYCDYINNKLVNNFSLEYFSVVIKNENKSAPELDSSAVSIKIIEENSKRFEEFINSKIYYLNQPKLKISYLISPYSYYNAENYNIRMLSTYLLQQRVKIEEIDFSSDIKNKNHILEFIKHYQKFKILNLEELNIDDNFFKNLLETLPLNNNEHIFIDLKNNKLTADIIPVLITLSHNSNYTFDIRKNNLSYDISLFSPYLTENNYAKIGIKNNYRLSSSDGFIFPINDSYIYLDLSFELIAKLVSTRKIVRKLILDPSKFNAVNFKELIQQHITNNPILVEFKMSGRKLFIEGIKELAKIINDKACNLTHIDLSTDFEEDGLSNEAVMLLLEKLQDNTKLIALNLNGNPINGGINNTLQACLKNNKTLTNLNLESTDIDENTAKSVIQALSKGNNQNKSLVFFSITPRKSPKKSVFSKATNSLFDKFKSPNIGAKVQLANAVDEGDLDKTRGLLGKASLYICNDEGIFLLFKAIEKGHLHIVKELVLSRNYNLFILNKYNQTPLEYAESLKKQTNKAINLEEIIKILTTPELFNNTYSNVFQANLNKRKAESEPTASSSTSKKPRLDQTPLTFAQNNNNNNQFIDIGNNLDTYTSDEQVTNQNNTNINPILNPSINNNNVVPNNISESYDLKNQFDFLVNLIYTNNIYYLTNYLSTTNIQLPSNLIDDFGNNLLHIAVLQGNLNIVNLLLQNNFDCTLLNLKGLSALELAINILTSYESNDTEYNNYLKIIYILIKENSTVPIDQINKAIQLGQYKLFKLFLNSSTCDINNKDIHQKTPIMYILDKQDIPMLDRLLIDRRLSSETINESLIYVRDLYSSYQPKHQSDLKIFDILINKLEMRIKSKYPEAKTGLQWVKKFNLFYGSHPEHSQKRVQINSNKQMAYLAEQNILNRDLKQASNEDEKKQILINSGNPVTASLVFIVSSGKYTSSHLIKRTKIRVELDFIETHHLYNDETSNALLSVKEKIKQRVAAAPQEAFNTTSIHRNNRSALTEEEIELKYQNYLNNNDPSFSQLLHHGEQSLLDDLEQDQTLLNIITRLKQHPKFTEGCKVYGVILEIYSPRYLCENCEVAILGEQNDKKSPFLTKLKQLLASHGCVLPTFNSLRMITLVSSEIHFNNQVDESEHYDFAIDIRSTNNNMILSRNNGAFNQPVLTQYHSNRLHHT